MHTKNMTVRRIKRLRSLTMVAPKPIRSPSFSIAPVPVAPPPGLLLYEVCIPFRNMTNDIEWLRVWMHHTELGICRQLFPWAQVRVHQQTSV